MELRSGVLVKVSTCHKVVAAWSAQPCVGLKIPSSEQNPNCSRLSTALCFACLVSALLEQSRERDGIGAMKQIRNNVIYSICFPNSLTGLLGSLFYVLNLCHVPLC